MKAYELLDGPETWCQGASAMLADGSEAFHDDSAAVRWCLEGAIFRCYLEGPAICAGLVVKALNRLTLAAWNDAPERTWEDVHALLMRLDL